MKTEEILLRQQIERLQSNEDYWAIYYYDKDTIIDPIKHFENKYGFKPTKIAVGPMVDLHIPENMLQIYDVDSMPIKQVWLQ